MQALLDVHSGAAVTLTGFIADDPTGYGRIVRDADDAVTAIVEHKDADERQRAISEVNAGIYAFDAATLRTALSALSTDNSQGEYYLTDVVEVLHDAGYQVTSMVVDDFRETQGVNDRVQLAAAEAELRRRTNEGRLRLGVTMVDPERTYIDATVTLAPDVTLFPGTILQGQCVVGAGCELGPNTRLVDCVVGEGSVVEASSGRDAEVGAGAHVGPYAVLEPGSAVPDGARTGSFYTAVAADDAS